MPKMVFILNLVYLVSQTYNVIYVALSILYPFFVSQNILTVKSLEIIAVITFK